ncbi:MAG: hypothetical protein ACI81R_000144 [Bradymonadia bacterium]|jgi:hypothetical protein
MNPNSDLRVWLRTAALVLGTTILAGALFFAAFAWLDGASGRDDRATDVGGTLWQLSGICLLGGAGLLFAFRRALAARKRGVLAVAAGVWPFVAFAIFIFWRATLSGEQLAWCESGDAIACDTLAQRKAKRDEPELAIELYTRGCELGHGHSCLGLSSMTEGPARADALRAACAAANGTACNQLARGLRRGRIEARPGEDDAEISAKACELGVASSCGAHPP